SRSRKLFSLISARRTRRIAAESRRETSRSGQAEGISIVPSCGYGALAGPITAQRQWVAYPATLEVARRLRKPNQPVRRRRRQRQDARPFPFLALAAARFMSAGADRRCLPRYGRPGARLRGEGSESR